MSRLRVVFALVLVACLSIHLAGPARSQASIYRTEAERKLLNANRVGLATGSTVGTYSALGGDLATILDSANRSAPFRVVVSLSQGSLNNIDDLRYLDRIDAAIVQSDVLAKFRDDPRTYSDLSRELRMVAPLHLEEIHILARRNVSDVRALQGKKVNIGAPSSGTQITARNLFHELGVEPEWDERTTAQARDALIAGKIDAMVYVVGKPASVFTTIKAETAFAEQLQFVPLGTSRIGPYIPTELTDVDYGNLIPQGHTVKTLASPAVLVVYGFSPQDRTGRYGPLKTFVERLFENAPQLVRGGFSPKWCQVDLGAAVAGWQRFTAAEEWLQRHPGPTSLCDRAGAQCVCARPVSCQARFIEDARAQGLRFDDLTLVGPQRMFADWRRTHPDCTGP